jgi:hypothetical protein
MNESKVNFPENLIKTHFVCHDVNILSQLIQVTIDAGVHLNTVL